MSDTERLRAIQERFGDPDVDALQGRIRALFARAAHDRTFGPAQCRRAVNNEMQKFIADLLRAAETRQAVTDDDEWRLVRVGEVGPKHGGHGSWVETDHQAVVDCMGSSPDCAANGCQFDRQQKRIQILEARQAQLEAAILNLQPPKDWMLPVTYDGNDLLGADNCLLIWDGELGQRAGLYIERVINGLAALLRPASSEVKS